MKVRNLDLLSLKFIWYIVSKMHKVCYNYSVIIYNTICDSKKIYYTPVSPQAYIL